MQTQVLIIGAGVTGTGLARDLAMRGVDCIIVEKGDINAGASGGNHGLLHSGARYIDSDPVAATECHLENRLLKKLAPHCIENTGGLFVAVAGDNEKYIADFAQMSRQCGIGVHKVDLQDAREMEPALSDRLIAAYAVNDATIDPFRLSLENIGYAQKQGCRLLCHYRVTGFSIANERIQRIAVHDDATGREHTIDAQMVVNASGAWAGNIAAMAGAHIPMRYSKGSLLITQNRITHRVINRLRPATDGDILVPGGTVSILGTTSERVPSPDDIHPEIQEIDAIIEQGATIVPQLASTRYIRAYCGVRPLMGDTPEVGDQDDRTVSRGFMLIDHAQEPVKIDNFVTITGGKLTTYRLMAEKAADLVCRRIGVRTPCRTHLEPLPDSIDARWTEPGLAPNIWMGRNTPDDMLLCECEMVPQSVIGGLVSAMQKHGNPPSLKAIGLRSRIGKGPCQGTFCSQRLAAYLYDGLHLGDNQGIAALCDFLKERWRGQQPLLWDTALAQAELLEAMHCGFFNLELAENGHQ